MRTAIAALLCASALGVAAPVLAQPYGPPDRMPAGPAMAGHDLRGQLETLEHRIQDGDRSGQLDRGEFDRATRELQNIRDAERNMRARNGGELTDVNRGMLQQRIDQLARSIHWMREHGPTPPPVVTPPPPVIAPPPPGPMAWSLERREAWMQERIDRSRTDGSLSRREAYRAQRALSDIRSTQARFMRRDYGRLSDAHRAYIEQRLDRLRDSLRWMRGNGETAPWAQR